MKRFFVLLTIAIFIIAGCTPDSGNNSSTSSGDEEKVVVIALGNDPQHFNTNFTDASSGGYITANVLNSLVALDDAHNILPDLANDWEIADDAKEYTFHLEEGVKWHDGEDFSSKDVQWTINEILDKKGFDYDQLKLVEEVETPDDTTVVIKLSEPNSALLSVLTNVKILPAHIYEGTDWGTNPANQEPIGTGPFKFVEHKKAVSITLEANEDYFKGRPNVDRLIFNIIPDENTVVQSFLNGEVDIIDYSSALSPGAVPELEKADDVKMVQTISNSRQYMIMNLDRDPWKDAKVREAFAYAIDRDEIVDKAHKGYAEKAEGFYTPTVEWSFNDVDIMPERDIEKAKELLDEAGLTEDSNGVRIDDLQLLLFEFPVFNDIAKVVQSNLKEIGIESTISSLEYSAWDEKVRNGDFDVTILGGNWGIDPEHLSVRTGSSGSMNLMNYSNSDIDELLAEGLKVVEQEDRADIYKEVQKLMSEDYPLLPLTEWMYLFAMKDNITGHPIDDGIGKVGGADYSLIDIED